ncbi:hypothetical protein ACFE04_004833 [Oxalis oulophora]
MFINTGGLSVKTESSLSDMEEEDSHFTMDNGNRKNKNTRRFSDEQIKLLEYMFESESRPESGTKQQLAKRVGLNPRQVAIWFQNRRARLKTKQIEHDYNILKASYDALLSKFESLKSQNQSLRHQLQRLNDQTEKEHGSKTLASDADEKGCATKCKNEDDNFELEEKPKYLLQGYDHKLDEPVIDDNNRNDIALFDGLEQTEASLSSPQNWCMFESNCNSQWWDFWP